MSGMPTPPLQMNSCTKFLEAFTFLSFLRKSKIILFFIFEVFWIDNIKYIFDYIKMSLVLILTLTVIQAQKKKKKKFQNIFDQEINFTLKCSSQ